MRASVVIPTLHGGDSLRRCVDTLEAQTLSEFEIVIVDNSGRGIARDLAQLPRIRLIENAQNVGFGEAINQGAAASRADYVCTLNDDAYPEPGWLAALVAAADSDPAVGMCASLILLEGQDGEVDSAGLGMYPDGTAKQAGRNRSAGHHTARQEVLLPSGCAALYRRSMLEQIGGFDGEYFLYGEDSDVGLRARLAGWKCLFEPRAVVSHDYSGSAGRASRLKAFYVERNRLFTVFKLFPFSAWMLSPGYALARYWAHWRAAAKGGGLAGELGRRESPLQLVLIVLQAHGAALAALPRLWSLRRQFRRHRKLSAAQFRSLLQRHRISAREIAEQ
ncbi:MAG: glycosyltransferase family 2 protein [Acidobacteria bacterium]|nr:glycosyltransferase family 2 protein [Acidobacteriota bacterium]MDA1236636.1 glycosyltransferase family 2 protein [Acidobacteriota bacterium]